MQGRGESSLKNTHSPLHQSKHNLDVITLTLQCPRAYYCNRIRSHCGTIRSIHDYRPKKRSIRDYRSKRRTIRGYRSAKRSIHDYRSAKRLQKRVVLAFVSHKKTMCRYSIQFYLYSVKTIQLSQGASYSPKPELKIYGSLFF